MIRFSYKKINDTVYEFSNIDNIPEIMDGIKLNDFGYFHDSNKNIVIFDTEKYLEFSFYIITKFLQSQAIQDITSEKVINADIYGISKNSEKFMGFGILDVSNNDNKTPDSNIKKIFPNETKSSGNSTGTLIGMSTGTSTFNQWGFPERIAVNEYDNKIEMIYKQTSTICYTSFPAPPPEVRLYKIIFSCINGKWNKSEPIYGKIIPAREEYYEFED